MKKHERLSNSQKQMSRVDEEELFLAAREAPLAPFISLIREKKYDIHATNLYGSSLLIEAVRSSNTFVAMYLTRQKANPLCKDRFGFTAFHYALQQESLNLDLLNELTNALKEQGKSIMDIRQGPCLQMISDSPGDFDKREVLNKLKIIFFRNEQGLQISYCSNNGEYTQETIDNDALVKQLETYQAGDYIDKIADLWPINDYLISKNSAPLPNHNPLTLLHSAINDGREAAIQYLEPLFAINPAFLDPTGQNLAVFAALRGRTDLADHYINQYGLNIRQPDSSGQNILFLVISRRGINTQIFDWLIDTHLFNLDERNQLSDTPLIFSTRAGNWKITDYLLNKITGDLNVTNATGDHVGHYLASQNQHERIQSLLQKNRIDVWKRNVKKETMLDFAIKNRAHLVIEVCINHIRAQTKKNNGQPIESLVKIVCLPGLLAFFLSHHGTIFGPWVEEGQPPLHIACFFLPETLLEELINRFKIDVNQRNQENNSALQVMVKGRLSKESLKRKIPWFIKKFQPKITNLDSMNSTLLHLACENEDLDFAKYCLEQHQLSILKPRKDHLNSMDLALIKQNLSLVTYLWEHLSPTDQITYIHNLENKNESAHISYLVDNHLFVPPLSEKEEEAAEEDEKQSSGSSTPEIISTPSAPFVCDRDLLFKAIDEHQIDYIKSLKHHREYHDMLGLYAEEALFLAVEEGHYALVYHLLRIPSIAKRAHKHDNAALARAQELGFFNITECLLRVPDVLSLTHQQPDNQASMINTLPIEDQIDSSAKDTPINDTFFQLNPFAPAWIGYPKCCQDNPALKQLVDRLSTIVKRSTCEHAYIYGSFHFKNPNDLDILLPSLTSEKAHLSALVLINLLIADTGKVTVKDRLTGEYGYKKHGLHIVPMDWRGIKIEWILTEKDYLTHALMLDFTLGAQYFNLRTSRVHEVPGLNSREHVQNKQIHAIGDAFKCFNEDLSRLFRAVRLMANEGFQLSQECDEALKRIFKAHNNPFNDMNKDKLNQQIRLLFKSPKPLKNVAILYEIGVLDKLFDCIKSNFGEDAAYYTEQLRPYHAMYYPNHDVFTTNPFMFYSRDMSSPDTPNVMISWSDPHP
jgi:ankyrin repeat protein